jgi:hypothetical protein
MNIIRTEAHVQRVSVFLDPRAIFVRTGSETLPLVEWLVAQLDTANTAPVGRGPEYAVSEEASDVVRLIYLRQPIDREAISVLVATIRSKCKTEEVNSLGGRTLVMRGTAEQFAAAEGVIAVAGQN